MDDIFFDGFDSNGKLTGKKVMICCNQFEDCKHQGFFGEGAFLICKLNKCIYE